MFHQYWDTVIPAQSTRAWEKWQNSTGRNPTRRLSDYDLWEHFGDGHDYNVGISPKEGDVIVNLDGKRRGMVRGIRRFYLPGLFGLLQKSAIEQRGEKLMPRRPPNPEAEQPSCGGPADQICKEMLKCAAGVGGGMRRLVGGMVFLRRGV